MKKQYNTIQISTLALQSQLCTASIRGDKTTGIGYSGTTSSGTGFNGIQARGNGNDDDAVFDPAL